MYPYMSVQQDLQAVKHKQNRITKLCATININNKGSNFMQIH